MSLFRKYYCPIRKKGILNIAGLELTKFINPLKKLEQQIFTLQRIINSSLDITKLSIASGKLREQQLECIKLLDKIDIICKNYNLQYFLSFGTLLGAKRHNGFIPWDDDIDITMLRNDYEKIIPILKDNFKNTNYIIREGICNRFQLRIQNKENNELGIDIFPMDIFYKKDISPLEREKLNKTIKKSVICFSRKYNSNNILKNRNLIKNITQLKILNNNPPIDNGLLFYGIDYPHPHADIVFEYNSIFPLKTINFEGNLYPCPNSIDKHLEQLYKNHMQFPVNIFNDR